jgi:putative ABC transport system substrate-binding protein
LIMMRRREFIAGLGGTAAAWPLATTGPGLAQQPTKIPRVGILTPAATEATPAFQAFREGIRDLGYVEGQTIVLDFRFARGNLDALPSLAAELVRTPVDVIVTDSTSGTVAAFSATRMIPIVMATTGGDPVALGVAKSIARPGGNVTGLLLRSYELSGRRLQLLKYAVPAIARVTVLANPKSAIGPLGQQATEDAAKLLGVAITPLAVGNPDELRALEPAVLTGSDGLTVVNDAMFWNNRTKILALASAAVFLPFIRSASMRTTAALSLMGQTSLITLFRRQVMSIAYYEAPSPVIFPSTNRRNWISS